MRKYTGFKILNAKKFGTEKVNINNVHVNLLYEQITKCDTILSKNLKMFGGR